MLFGENKVYLGDALLIDNSKATTIENNEKPVYIDVDGQKYRQIMFDDFEKIDLTHWSTEYNKSKYQPIYTAQSDVYCKDSILHLRTTEDMGVLGGTSWSAGVSGIQTVQFSTPTSNNKFTPFFGFISQEGYYELKAKIYSGEGTHCAWWMTGIDDVKEKNAEIDIFEILGRTPSNIPINYYADTTTTESAVKQVVYQAPVDVSKDFHVYGFLWENGMMKFYLDGKLINEWNDIETPQVPLMTWLTAYRCTSGTYWAGKATEGLGTLEMLVDYFKVYKKCDFESEEHPSIINQSEINVNLSHGEYAIDDYTGRFGALPSYVYLYWSDGSRTEHAVRWNKMNADLKNILDNGGTYELIGIAVDVDYEVTAQINVS